MRLEDKKLQPLRKRRFTKENLDVRDFVVLRVL